MAEEFDSAIKEFIEDFDRIHMTEDPRTGIDRRYKIAKEFPIKDSKGNLIARDRRTMQERRTDNIDIDDISEYENG